MSKMMNKIAAGFEKIKQREEAELRKLCEQPEMFDVAQSLTDAMLSSLLYLCNFSHLVSGYGDRVEMDELDDRLRKDILAEFKRLTGKDYQPDVVRTSRFNV